MTRPPRPEGHPPRTTFTRRLPSCAFVHRPHHRSRHARSRGDAPARRHDPCKPARRMLSVTAHSIDTEIL